MPNNTNTEWWKTENPVALEIWKNLQSPGFYFAIALVPLLGLMLAKPLHLPEIPQWFFWGFWVVMPIKMNLWERVVGPTLSFVGDLAMVGVRYILWPLLLVAYEILKPLYDATLKPYEERFIKPLAIPLFLGILLYEEIILWGLRKLVLPGVHFIIRITPAPVIVALFGVLELGKLLAKPLVPVAFGLGFLYGIGLMGVMFLATFLSMQILTHGSEKLRSIAWFNRLYEWAVDTLGPYKEMAKKWWKSQSVYNWLQEMKTLAAENKQTFFAQVLDTAKSWKRK